jgi:hypothetical protein
MPLADSSPPATEPCWSRPQSGRLSAMMLELSSMTQLMRTRGGTCRVVRRGEGYLIC